MEEQYRDEADFISNDGAIHPDMFIPDDIAEVDEDGSSRWQVKNLADADWALRKRDFYKERMARNLAAVKVEADRLTNWLSAVNAKEQMHVDYFEGQLRRWHENQITANPADAKAWKHEKNKTIDLPSGGKLAMAKNPASVEIDEDVFVPWATDNHPEWLKIERKIVRTPIKPDIKAALLESKGNDPETGEIVPGVVVRNDALRWEAVSA